MPPSLVSNSLRLSGVLLGLGIAGCAPKNAPPPTPVTYLALQPTGAASPAKLPESRLRPLFAAGHAPSVFQAAAKLDLGMPLKQAKVTAPELFGATPSRSTALPDVGMKGEGDAYQRLGSLVLLLPRKPALGDVMGLWGESVKGYDASSKSDLYWWFDPTSRLRARLENDDAPETSRLVFERYFPIEELIGRTRDKFGFEKEALLGMTDERAAQVYPEYFPPAAEGEHPDPLCRSEILMLPPVEYDSTPTRIRVQCGSHGVSSYEVKVRYKAYVALKDDIVRLLQLKFGEPTKKKDIMGREVLEYPQSSLHVRFRDDDKMKDAVIEVSRSSTSPM